jgi:hypothetical protein
MDYAPRSNLSYSLLEAAPILIALNICTVAEGVRIPHVQHTIDPPYQAMTRSKLLVHISFIADIICWKTLLTGGQK